MRCDTTQQNKAFKSRHATKSALKEISKGAIIVATNGVIIINRKSGRTQRPSPKSPAINTAAQIRFNRRNTQKQIQAAKRASIVAATRIFNGVEGAPRIVAVIPLCKDIHAGMAVRALAVAGGEEVDGLSEKEKLWRMKYATQ